MLWPHIYRLQKRAAWPVLRPHPSRIQGRNRGADPKRVDEMKKRMELVYAEMEPGDGLFFHANVMHRSDRNRSPDRRWTVLFCFNAARNNPTIAHHHPQYTPLLKVPDSAVLEAGVRFAVGEGANFRKSADNPPELTRRMPV